MRTEILIPKMGMTMTEATVIEWLVAPGGRVSVDDPILTIETDKTTFDIEAEVAGTVEHGAEKGAVLEPGAVVGWVLQDG